MPEPSRTAAIPGQHVPAKQERPEPTGIERHVESDELFFSTTDRKGIIRSANSVFSRVSGYGMSQLIGAPHNIVRHPDMPAGVFHIMWERLLSGQSMAGYVLNLGRDGRHYWVFATITPMGTGFLSVRMAPRATPLLQAAWELYEDVVESEARARRRGASRSDAAALGAQYILNGIEQLGFADYDAFMSAALPAEVAARSGLIEEYWSRPMAKGPVAGILQGAVVLDDHLKDLVSRLEHYGELAHSLEASSRAVLATALQLAEATAAARESSAAVAGRVPVLHSVATAMAGPSGETVRTLRSVVADLERLRAEVSDVRWRIALARTHNDMVASFAAEVLDHQAPATALAEVPVLCDAVAEGVGALTLTLGTINERLTDVAVALEGAGASFSDVRRLIGKWRLLVLRFEASTALAASVVPIDMMLRDGHQQLGALRELAQQCAHEVVPLDIPTLDAALDRMRQAVATLQLSELVS